MTDDVDAGDTAPHDLRPHRDEAAGRPGRRGGDRAALLVFAAQLLGAAILIRYLNRDQWFRYDEWEVLYERSLGDPSTLFRNWNGHPVTLTAVAYRGLYRLVGLHHYWPYQLLTIAGHLGVVICLRELMRRMRVNPWLANAVLAGLLVYGASQDDLAWGFQVVYTGSLALGLAQVLLVDHDGPTDWRDAVAVVAGTAAVWTGASGPLVVGFGALVALTRRGPRPALLQAAPLVPFVGWVAFAPQNAAGIDSPTATPGVALTFSARVIGRTLEGLGRFPPLTIGFGLAAVAGAVLLIRTLRTPGWRHRPVAPLAVTAAAGAMAVVIGFSRAAPTPSYPRPVVAPRYLYLVAALLLPAVVLALDHLTRRRRAALVIVIAALLVPLPRSIDDVGPANFLVTGFEAETLVWAEVGDRMRVRGDYQPWPLFNPGLRVSSLAEAHRTGKAPDPPAGQDDQRSTATLTLALAPHMAPVPGGAACRPLPRESPTRLARGDFLRVGTPGTRIAQAIGGVARGALDLPAGSTRRVLHGPLDVTFAARAPATVSVCR